MGAFIYSWVKKEENLEAIILKAQRDVRLVNERAKIVLNILNDEEIEIRRNNNFSLNVMAITAMGYDGEELCEEIGLYKTKPFRASQIGRTDRKRKLGPKPGRRTCCPARHQNGGLSEEQYSLAAPVVFQELQRMVDERVAGWGRGPSAPYRIRVPVYKRYGRGRITVRMMLLECQRGLRFSVRAGSSFAQDACWAELNSNVEVRRYLEYLATSFHECLAGYNTRALQMKGYKLKGFRCINHKLAKSNIPEHLLLETFRYLPEDNGYYNQLAEFIGWDQERVSAERQLSNLALPDPVARIGRIQIRTLGIDKGFLTFEVLPRT